VNPAKPAPGNALAAIAKRAAALSAGVAIENKKWGLIIAPKWERWQLMLGAKSRTRIQILSCLIVMG